MVLSGSENCKFSRTLSPSRPFLLFCLGIDGLATVVGPRYVPQDCRTEYVQHGRCLLNGVG